jgi:hypothetical protein
MASTSATFSREENGPASERLRMSSSLRHIGSAARNPTAITCLHTSVQCFNSDLRESTHLDEDQRRAYSGYVAARRPTRR